MAQQPQLPDHPNVQGWGADLDPKKRPAYPKERTPPRFINPHWTEPDQQIPKVKIFRSTERPSLTPVFGTSTPPAGLSGKIRDVAYQLSENDVRHWFLLLLADRVNVVEGLADDLRRGCVPNIFAEMGLGSELKYNRQRFKRKAFIALGVLSLLFVSMKGRD